MLYSWLVHLILDQSGSVSSMLNCPSDVIWGRGEGCYLDRFTKLAPNLVQFYFRLVNLKWRYECGIRSIECWASTCTKFFDSCILRTLYYNKVCEFEFLSSYAFSTHLTNKLWKASICINNIKTPSLQLLTTISPTHLHPHYLISGLSIRM